MWPVGELADPLGGRPQLPREVVLHRRLQRAEAVEAELGGEPDDGGRPGAGLRREVGDGAEGDEMRALEHGLGDAPLGRRELGTGGGDAVGDLQLSHRPARSTARPEPCTPARSARSHRAGSVHTVACSFPRHRNGPSPATTPSGAHPDVIAAIVAANDGHALAYGDDEWTRRVPALVSPSCSAARRRRCSRSPAPAATCSACRRCCGRSTPSCAPPGSHVNVDEAGAMERIAGAKLIDLPAPDGKLVPEQLRDARPAARQRAPRPAGRRVDHPEHRARHRLHRRRGGRARARRPTRWG